MNLIFGPNGSGKSLIIEAIYKFLTKEKKSRGYDRVNELPEGYLVFESDGKEVKLERDQDINDLFHLDIDHLTLKNLFFVKDSDLQIENDSDFYDQMTNKIIGIRTSDIQKIKDELLKKGRLTKSRNLSDSTDYGKAKSQLEEAKRLLNAINYFLDSQDIQALQKLETTRYALEEERNDLKKRKELLKAAKKKEEFQKLKSNFEDAKRILKDLSSLPSEEVLNEFRIQIEQLEKEEANHPLADYNTKLKLAKSNSQRSFVLLAFGTVIALIITAINSSLFPYVIGITALLLLPSMAFFAYFCILSRKIAIREQKINDLTLRLSLSLKQPISTITEGKNALEHLKNRYNELRDSFAKATGKLEDHFKIKINQNEESLGKVFELLEKMKKEVDFNIHVSFSDEEYEAIDEKIDELEQKLKGLSEEWSSYQEQLREFSRRFASLNFQEFLGEEVEFFISNIEALNKMRELLNKFIKAINDQAELCIKALEIFDKMEEREKLKKEELFSDEYLTNIIRTITNGYLIDIGYNSIEDFVVIIKKDGTSMNLKDLSKGEQCQTLLAIRLALVFKYLENTKGFLIFENPLLASDDERTSLQLSLLERIANEGWQIIFFSSKNLIRDYFVKNFGADRVIKLNRIE